MIVKTMVQPSSWVEGGIKLQKVRGLNLFKFTDELQAGLETLISRKKANLLTPEETYATWRHLAPVALLGETPRPQWLPNSPELPNSIAFSP